jgi:hypothetical protein
MEGGTCSMNGENDYKLCAKTCQGKKPRDIYTYISFSKQILHREVSYFTTGKLNLSLCLTKYHVWTRKRRFVKHHNINTYTGVKLQLHAFLTSALDGGEWSAARPGRFTPGVRAPGTYWIGRWVGPSAGLDAVARRKNPYRESNSGRPSCSLVTTVLNYTNST